MRKLFYILSLTSLVIIGCKKDKDNNDNNNNGVKSPVAIQLDSFPLMVGHSWTFYTEVHLADSTGVVYENHYYTNYWTVVSDTIINGVPAAKISQLDSNYNGTTHLGYTYYANKPNGFFGMAVDNFGSMFYLKTISNTEVSINSYLQISKLTNVDTIFVPSSPLWFLKFPSTLNDIWHTVKYGTSGSYYQTRKYDGYQTVTTSAGTFDCLKTKIYFENNGQADTTSSTVYQYFASKGLIQETQFIHLLFSEKTTGTMSRTTKLIQVNF